MIDEETLLTMMQELNEKLELYMCNTDFLADAMCRDGIECANGGFNGRECRSRALAELGHSVLDLVITETLYSEGRKGRRIAEVRNSPERRALLKEVALDEGLDAYTYGEGSNQEVLIIEAIIGAKMADSDFYECRNWINVWLRPRLMDLMGRGIGDCPGKERRRSCIQ